jgi:hypothetical protein
MLRVMQRIMDRHYIERADARRAAHGHSPVTDFTHRNATQQET